MKVLLTYHTSGRLADLVPLISNTRLLRTLLMIVEKGRVYLFFPHLMSECCTFRNENVYILESDLFFHVVTRAYLLIVEVVEAHAIIIQANYYTIKH